MSDTDWEKMAISVANEARSAAVNREDYVESLKTMIETLEARLEAAEREPFTSEIDDDDDEPDFAEGEGELDFG